MTQSIKGVLYDLDGVLVDSYSAWFHLLNAAARKYGYPDIDKDKYDLLFGQSVEADVEILFRGMEPKNLAEFFENHFFDYIHHFEKIDGAIHCLQNVAKMDLLSCVVTNTTTPLAREILDHIGAEPDYLVGSGDVARDKPAPDMVLKACELMKLTVDEVVMVGDSDFDARAAGAAGVVFVGFRRSGDFSVDSHSEFLELLKTKFLPE